MFKVPEDVTNKYEFVTLAARRAEQLQMGAVPRVESVSSKHTVIAQQEIASGVIRVVDANQEAQAVEVEEEE